MANPNVQPNGGKVIGSIQLVPVFWGNGWPYDAASPLIGQLQSFLEDFVGANSPLMQMLAEYSTGGTTIQPGNVVNNSVVFAPGTPPASLTDAQIWSALQGWITNQGNQSPDFPQPGQDVVFMIFLPQSVSVTNAKGQLSCQPTNSFNGYHSWNGSQPYIVIPCCVFPTTTPYNVVLNVLTTVCSHELCEVISDPLGNGWIDANTPPPNPSDEIGDICQGTGYPQFANAPAGIYQASPAQSFQVQSMWSQLQNNCVFGPPVRLTKISTPPFVFGGQPFAGTVTLSNPAPILPATGLAVSLITDNPDVAFTSTPTVLPGLLAAQFTANTTAVAEPTVVTITATIGGVPVHQIMTLLPPNIAAFRYTPTAAQGYQYPPNAPIGTLALNLPPPAGGLIVGITSSNPSLVTPIPDELPIAAAATSPSVPFYLLVNPAGVTTSVTLTADVAGTSVPFTFEVLAGGPSNIMVRSLTLTPATLIGGGTSYGQFKLAAAVGPGGGNIVVESSDPAAAHVYATVNLPAGATGGTFPIQTVPLQRPTTRKYVTIMAGKDGTPAHALLTITS